MAIELSADKAKITMEGDDLIAFRDVCNAAALSVSLIKAIGCKTACGALSKENTAWVKRVDGFISELKGRAFMLEIATCGKEN